MKSKVIAISAISAGFVAIALTVGAYIEMADLFSLVVASAFLMLPLYYNSYKGAILSFLAGGVIAFLFSGFNIFSIVFPAYFVFFGIYPILTVKIRSRKQRNTLWTVIGLIWCVLFFYGAYYYYTGVMKLNLNDFPEYLSFISDYIMYFIALIGAIFYFVFDRFIIVVKLFVDRYLKRIVK